MTKSQARGSGERIKHGVPKAAATDDETLEALATMIRAFEGGVPRHTRTELARSLRARVIEARAESYVQRCERDGVRPDVIGLGIARMGDELDAVRSRPAESLLGPDQVCPAGLQTSLVGHLAMKLVTFDEFANAVYERILARALVEVTSMIPKLSEREARRILLGGPEEAERFIEQDKRERASRERRRASKRS